MTECLQQMNVIIDIKAYFFDQIVEIVFAFLIVQFIEGYSFFNYLGNK